jgi:hypothetical protein
VDTNSVPTSTLRVFTCPGRICESQGVAVTAIITDQSKAGDSVLIRYEGPRAALVWLRDGADAAGARRMEGGCW